MKFAAYLPGYGSPVLATRQGGACRSTERLAVARPRRASGDSEAKTRREIAEIGGRLPHITIHSYRLIVFLISQKDYRHCINKHFDFNFPFRGKDRRSCPPSCFRLLPRLAPLLPSEEGKGAEASKKAGGADKLRYTQGRRRWWEPAAYPTCLLCY